ncbi:hypothetical protein L3Q67_45215 (plasmid) [Saccharothrix sp. AJ9571]|nr:hypothetical protein L3Q67_45215 [Saccharothrix sp. AJ9571]
MRSRIRTRARWYHRDRQHPGGAARRCSPPRSPATRADLVDAAATFLGCSRDQAEPHVRAIADRLTAGMPPLVVPEWVASNIGDHPAAQPEFVALIRHSLESYHTES